MTSSRLTKLKSTQEAGKANQFQEFQIDDKEDNDKNSTQEERLEHDKNA